MSHISSINLQKSKDYQVFHNTNIRPNYAIGGELSYTLKGYEALKLKNQIIENAKEQYTKRTGQKFQAKSYEWSAVCNIKPNTTMQDLEKLAEHFNQKYGFQCYQIAIHRDEGHINEKGEKVINHHAHLEFVTLDRQTGKNNYRRELITPKVLRQIQTEVAEILGMQRGQDKRLTGVKRIEPRKYAQMKEQEKQNAKELKQELRKTKQSNLELEQALLSQKDFKSQIEAFRKQCIGKGYPKDFFRDLTALKQSKEPTTKELLNATLEDLAKGYEEAHRETKQQKSKINSLESDLKAKEQKIDELVEKNKKNDLRGDFELLKAENERLRKENRFLEKICNASMRFIKMACKSMTHGFAYKRLSYLIGDFQTEPTLENYKKTSLKYFKKNFKETMKWQTHNIEKVNEIKSWNNTQKENLKSEIRLNGLSDENRELIERTLNKEKELELQKNREFSR